MSSNNYNCVDDTINRWWQSKCCPMILVVLISSISFPSIAGCGRISVEPNSYSLVFISTLNGCDKFQGVTVFWGKHAVVLGDSVGGTYSIDSYATLPPEEFTVSWGINGERFTATGKTSPELRESFRECSRIAIVIYEDRRVKAIGRPREQSPDEDYPGQNYFRVVADGHPAFFVGVKNATGRTYRNLKLNIGTKTIFCGGMLRRDPAKKNRLGYWGNKGWSFRHSFPFEPSGVATMSWTYLDGKTHSQTVDLTGKLPADIEDQTLCFVILGPDDVRFEVRPWKDRNEWMLEKFYGRE